VYYLLYICISNKKLLALAETIRAQYELDLAYDTLNLHKPSSQYTTFLAHFNNCIQKREGKTTTAQWKSVLSQLQQYDKWNTLACDIDENYCSGFLDFCKNATIILTL